METSLPALRASNPGASEVRAAKRRPNRAGCKSAGGSSGAWGTASAFNERATCTHAWHSYNRNAQAELELLAARMWAAAGDAERAPFSIIADQVRGRGRG